MDCRRRVRKPPSAIRSFPCKKKGVQRAPQVSPPPNASMAHERGGAGGGRGGGEEEEEEKKGKGRRRRKGKGKKRKKRRGREEVEEGKGRGKWRRRKGRRSRGRGREREGGEEGKGGEREEVEGVRGGGKGRGGREGRGRGRRKRRRGNGEEEKEEKDEKRKRRGRGKRRKRRRKGRGGGVGEKGRKRKRRGKGGEREEVEEGKGRGEGEGSKRGKWKGKEEEEKGKWGGGERRRRRRRGGEGKGGERVEEGKRRRKGRGEGEEEEGRRRRRRRRNEKQPGHKYNRRIVNCPSAPGPVCPILLPRGTRTGGPATITHPFCRRPNLALVVGHPENPEFQSYRQTMERHRLPSDLLSPQQLAERFPGIHPYGGEMAVMDPTAGVLYASKALRAVQDLFQRHEGVLRDGEKVLQILPGSVVTVTTDRGKYRAKRLVVTAGAWTNQLLAPLGLQLPLQPLRVRVCYLRVKVPGPRGLPGLPPCFLGIGLNGDDHHFYGLRTGEYPDLIKVCYHHGSPVDPDKPDQHGGVSTPVSDLQRLQDFVSKYLPGLDQDPAVQEWCLYTNTPDGDFILDRHPRFENIVIGAGFSGHGFKFAPVVGKILCELSLGEPPTHDLTPFRLSRFQGPLKASL
ncbi:peroxisomal sarcosine oxidase [Crotalus adamanteus]|uniref:L-amino-acid oxidase n=1 Tax=Crotalus adamanteus TaxID=8729 RepID=A0AAW1CI25_CROAD